jgi:hypothetical protein
MQIKANQINEGGANCGCGRSPTGKCIGWHSFSEEEFRERLAEYEDQLRKDQESLGE